MPTEQQIRELAYAIWEEEGRPDGRDQEHYFRAKVLLEQKERPLVEVTSSLSGMRLEAASPTPELEAPAKKRRTTTTTRRKKS